VESAAIYSLNHFLYAVLYEVKNQVESTPSFLVGLPSNLYDLLTRGLCRQEASLASITCSLIIVRSESTRSQPLSTTIGSGAMKAPEPLAFGKYSGNQDGKVFGLRSMEVTTDGSRTIEEAV